MFLGVLVRYLGFIIAASARLLSFRLPNRGDIVLSGVFGVYPPFSTTADSVRPVCGDIVILVALVLYFEAHKRILVILRGHHCVLLRVLF